ncbi:low molecular weight phosphatase family protein [Marinicauda algicola]|uniref:Low molecular weight phosphatase family protein n=2 Tax=Marinicauda algicola TaxID=2029849 RepID=A0A4S2H5P1_9PROT|nr:low molecular weight phosphatase family protein [Marinicauda algicola]
MAEALWKKTFGPDTPSTSCGVSPAGYPDGFMVSVMSEIGIDLSRFGCRTLDEVADAPCELVICLAAEAEPDAKALARARGAQYQRWQVSDPAMQEGHHGERLEAFRISRDAIAARIERFARERRA